MRPAPAFKRASFKRDVPGSTIDPAGKWTLHTDGACEPNPGSGGIGFVLTAPDGVVVYEASRGIGQATNNIAEYRALIEGLQVAVTVEIPALVVYSDSQLMVEQMKGRWRVKHPGIKPLHAEATGLAAKFRAIAFQWIPREQNEAADALAVLGVAAPPAELQAMDDHLLAIGREGS